MATLVVHFGFEPRHETHEGTFFEMYKLNQRMCSLPSVTGTDFTYTSEEASEYPDLTAETNA